MTIAIIILVVTAITFGFFSQPENAGASILSSRPSADGPSRWDLYNALRQHGKILIIHDARNAQEQQQFQDLATSMTNQRRWSLQTELKAAGEIAQEDLQNQPVFLVGCFQDHEWIRRLSNKLPFDIGEQSFLFSEKKYKQPEEVLKLSFYPNPLNQQWPIFLITGNDHEQVLNIIQKEIDNNRRSFYRNNWGYEIFRAGQPIVFGQFEEKSWQLDKNVHFDFSKKATLQHQSKHFSFFSYHPPFSQKVITELSELSESTYASIKGFTGATQDIQIDHFLYPSMENKGLRLDNTDEAHADFSDKKVHLILNDHFKGHYWQKENEILLRNWLGQPPTLAMEKGLGVYFSKQWQRKGYQYWAQRFFQSGNLPDLEDLLDNDQFARESDLVMYAAAGSFVNFLIDHWGRELFLEKYADWRPGQQEIQELEKKWKAQLKKAEAVSVEKDNHPLPYLKGFNFAHEGYSIYNGYGSSLAGQSLEKLRSIHANSVAIVPYSYMRDPRKSSFIPVSDGAGSENDESVIHAHYAAKHQGMTTVLKPQIWIGRGSWPGDVEMQSEEDWRQFFDYYYRWMRHYALMAEIHGFDMLCVGVEFAKATIQREQDWRRLIQKLRGLYSGPMTYAANWGEEFENLSFWDELDYIGLDCYYPLSDKEQPTKEELDQRFKQVLTLVERTCRKYNKPMIFTEIGFRSVEGVWKQPHEEPLGRPFSEHCQNLCYEVVLENLQGKDFCQGLLWWKWSCNLNNRERENTGFTPYDKAAQETVRVWFGKR